MEFAAAYFLTFTCYGTWLPGDERGSAERRRSPATTEVLEPDANRRARSLNRLRSSAVTLDAPMRSVVAESIQRVCSFKGWTLHALNVRTTHVHVVVTAESPPEGVLNSLKAWATRELRAANLGDAGGRTWTRHGSTRYLWTERDIEQASTYVLEAQGRDLGGTIGPAG